MTPLPGNGAMVVVDEVITNHAFDKAWIWIEEFKRAWRACHPDAARTVYARGFRFWGPVLYRQYPDALPQEVADPVAFAPEFFDRAFVTKGIAWVESFRASWMANEIDPEDVDDRGITLIWGPLMYVDRGNADPIELALETPVPDEFMPLLFPTYIRHEGKGGPIPDGYVQTFSG